MKCTQMSDGHTITKPNFKIVVKKVAHLSDSLKRRPLAIEHLAT